MKKWLCLLMTVILLLPVSGLSETAVQGPTEYLYTFIPGTVLEGEGTEMIREVMDAVQLQITTQSAEDGNRVSIRILSEDEEAFFLNAEQTPEEELKMVCSLLGNNLLLLQQDQMGSFLQTLVEVLSDKGIVRGESTKRLSSLAARLSAMAEGWLTREAADTPVPGINLKFWISKLTRGATSSEERMIAAGEEEPACAVKATTYLLSEEERRELVNSLIIRLTRLPVIGSKLRDGSLRIGEQPITDELLRTILADTPGEMTMDVYSDSSDLPVRITLHTPDLSELIEDPKFSKVRGIDMIIDREEEGHSLTSVTRLRLTGLEGELMTIRLDRGPGSELPPVSAKYTHNVGEMDSEEMGKLIRSMSLTIAGNAANMLLSLPKCVFDLAMNKIFKK